MLIYPAYIPPISQNFPIFCHFRVTSASLGNKVKMEKYKIDNGGKEAVTLRSRKMKDGGESLYLDYTANGIRYREFLRLYLVPEQTKLDKIKNQETIKTAQALKARKILGIAQGDIQIRDSQEDMELEKWVKERKIVYEEQGSDGFAGTLAQMLYWLEKYGKRVTLRSLTPEYIISWCDFMRKSGLKPNSVHLLYSALVTVLNSAIREGYLTQSPIARIDTTRKPKKKESEREYLTLEEVQQLIRTPCKKEGLKRAFLFSCFSGLRLSDIRALEWEQVRQTGDGLQVEMRQRKTKKVVYVPLSENALAFLPKRKSDGKVFSLTSDADICKWLRSWTEAAGIRKHITFHCARHTCATLLITYGADIYTVSSLLGHASVKTTQIYAKIVDKKKRSAVDLVPEIKV